MDEDLEHLSREVLMDEVRKLRAGIREHRDSSGHELCWHHPKLWGLLPGRVEPSVLVPEWPQFLRGASAIAKRSIANCPTHREAKLSIRPEHPRNPEGLVVRTRPPLASA